MGNLLSRICAPAINKRQVVPAGNPEELREYETSEKLIEKLKNLPSVYEEHFEAYNFYLAIDEIIAILHLTNALIQESQAWVLAKNPSMDRKLDAVLALAFESLRINGILLQPIVPMIAQHILDKINVSADSRSWNEARYQLDVNPCERPLSSSSTKLMDRIK